MCIDCSLECEKIEAKNGFKVCTKCGTEKELTQFSKNKKSSDGYKGTCKDCANLEYINKREYRINQSINYYKNNKESCLKKMKDYRALNAEWYQSYNVKYYENNKERCKENSKRSLYKRIKNDDGFKIAQRLRKRMYDAMLGISKSKRTMDLVGCSYDELKKHIESQFTKGMTWDNYGEWHVDHIVPCALFDFTNEDDQRKCFNYKNLQPLWAKENISKGKKLMLIHIRKVGENFGTF